MRGGLVERVRELIKSTRSHFAFYCGFLEGLCLRELAG